jgi:hypothetical protein
MPLSSLQIGDLRLAVSKLRGVERRSFQAEMTVKYCKGSARMAEGVFGWGRESVEVGLAEKRTGIVCMGAQAGYGGTKRWEERQPRRCRCAPRASRDSCPTSPDVSNLDCLYPFNRPRSDCSSNNRDFSESHCLPLAQWL